MEGGEGSLGSEPVWEPVPQPRRRWKALLWCLQFSLFTFSLETLAFGQKKRRLHTHTTPLNPPIPSPVQTFTTRWLLKCFSRINPSPTSERKWGCTGACTCTRSSQPRGSQQVLPGDGSGGYRRGESAEAACMLSVRLSVRPPLLSPPGPPLHPDIFHHHHPPSARSKCHRSAFSFSQC